MVPFPSSAYLWSIFHSVTHVETFNRFKYFHKPTYNSWSFVDEKWNSTEGQCKEARYYISSYFRLKPQENVKLSFSLPEVLSKNMSLIIASPSVFLWNNMSTPDLKSAVHKLFLWVYWEPWISLLSLLHRWLKHGLPLCSLLLYAGSRLPSIFETNFHFMSCCDTNGNYCDLPHWLAGT